MGRVPGSKNKSKRKAGFPRKTHEQLILANGHIAARLREIMVQRGIPTPAQLNAAAGFTNGFTPMYKWLRAEAAPQDASARKLAAAFGGMPADYMARDLDAAPSASPPAPFVVTAATPPRARAAEVFAFTVTSDGTARIRLDVTLPLAKARPLFTQLLQTGLLPEGRQDDEKQEESEQ